MSDFVSKPCACGVDIVSVSPDEDDIRIAVAAHRDMMKHREWWAVQVLKQRPRSKGPCICKGGEGRPAA